METWGESYSIDQSAEKSLWACHLEKFPVEPSVPEELGNTFQ